MLETVDKREKEAKSELYNGSILLIFSSTQSVFYLTVSYSTRRVPNSVRPQSGLHSNTSHLLADNLSFVDRG